MMIDIRLVAYIIGYIVTVITFAILLKFTLGETRKDLKIIKDIIFADKGNLNLIDVSTCEKNRDIVHNKIRNIESAANMMISEIKELNNNVIAIMVHMKINSPNGVKKDK